MPTPTLTGTFVDLLPLQAQHAELSFTWRQSPRAALLNRGAATVAQQAVWIANRPDSEHNFVIALKSGQPVGMLALVDIDRQHLHAQSGRFLIGDEAAVRGVPAAAEAMLLLYQLAFEQLGLQRVYGHVAAGNAPMIKWQRYMGMQEEGRWRRHWCIDGQWHDAVLLGLLADEYRTVAMPRLRAMVNAARPRAARTPLAEEIA